MENNERDRNLDQWLDEALSEYSAAEPRFGLEQRVLNRIRSQEQRARKWNLWRWMPAFGAIAAIVVVAVAVRPMLEKKAAIQPFNSSTGTVAGKTTTDANADSLPGRTTKPTNQPDLNGTLSGAPTLRRELTIVPKKEGTPKAGDRDRLFSAQEARVDRQQPATLANDKKEPASAGNVASLDSSAAEVAPPPPPPPPQPLLQVQPGTVGGVIGGIAGGAPPTPAKPALDSPTQNELKASTRAAEVQPNTPALLDNKAAAESVASALAKDARRKEAHTQPETHPQDPNTIEAFGVAVRFQTAPTVPQQFPTPVPLSKQERLALKAGPALKGTAVAQHNSTDIAPIEIKDIEIKPLEGPEKDK